MLSSLDTFYYTDENIDYIGDQLHSLFNFKTANMIGDSVFAFEGKMDVKTDHMVDIEDVKENDYIWSPKALNFIIEIFNINIETAVLYQRAFMQICTNVLKDILAESNIIVYLVKLKGDDILVKTLDGEVWKKLSVSIATVSHISGLIHVGINIDTDMNIPVPAIGLQELIDLHVYEFGVRVLEQFKDFHKSIKFASVKIKGV